ncbi:MULTISPECIES: hypothetical protein [unclassified Streptomyces]|uniref:hypothetical protein n=1 Tax=unclassified Streptomyces TaxID=2593676 RepID=UPI00093ABB03|nr:hypothetical protein [Streptomyces sp. CB01883]OKJ75480.1 hypothetical protein AMK32_34165 [Streptomyces sp. CB01883]
MFLLRLLPPLPREISLAVVGLVFGLFLAVMGSIHGFREVTGTAGTVRVTSCERATGDWDDLWEDGWACAGRFESDDHSVRIEGVALDGILDKLPDTTVAALVDGPAAHTALPDSAGRWKWPALTGVAILAFTAWRIRTVRTMLRLRRITGRIAAAPAA